MVYYLKINRKEAYTVKNLSHWLQIVTLDSNARIMILCDDENVKELVEDLLHDYPVECMESIKDDEEMQSIVQKITDRRWENAAYAHLTTFFHARENRIKEYWNIDADDTSICLNADRCYECLEKAKGYAKDNCIDIFSLDMWCTKTENRHWSFGVTYINNPEKWIEILKRYSKDDYLDTWQPMNIDGRFSVIKRSEEGIGTFYFENMNFLHYSNDFIRRPWASGIYKWINGKMISPILKDVYGLELGESIIPEDVVKLDIKISDEERQSYMLSDCYQTEKDALSYWMGRLPG